MLLIMNIACTLSVIFLILVIDNIPPAYRRRFKARKIENRYSDIPDFVHFI